MPTVAQIRLLPEIADTIELARRLEEAGCALLAVHGRSLLPGTHPTATCMLQPHTCHMCVLIGL